MPAISAKRPEDITRNYSLLDPFFARFAETDVRQVSRAGGTADPGRVSIYYENGTPPETIERVLAHEFAHTFQPSTVRTTFTNAAGDGWGTTDARIAQDSVTEGAAVFVADQYADRYLPSVANQSESIEARWATMPAALRYLWGPYRYGGKHIHSRVRSVDQLSIVYENPPLTSEQVIHGKNGDTEPLSLSVESTTRSWDLTVLDTKGEIYIRILLSTELSESRASRAAAGWGTDRLLTFYNGTRSGHVWVLRWDSVSDATEFEKSIVDVLDTIAVPNENGWSNEGAEIRYDCVTDRTCYLLTGDTDFVTAMRVTGNESSVRVEQ